MWMLVWLVGVGKLNVVGKKKQFFQSKKKNSIAKICKRSAKQISESFSTNGH